MTTFFGQIRTAALHPANHDCHASPKISAVAWRSHACRVLSLLYFFHAVRMNELLKSFGFVSLRLAALTSLSAEYENHLVGFWGDFVSRRTSLRKV